MAATLIAVFQRTLEISWQAAAIVVLALAMQIVLGRWLSPRWRCALWLIVFMRLVLPTLPPSPLSIFNLQRRVVPPPNVAAIVLSEPQTTIQFGTIPTRRSVELVRPTQTLDVAAPSESRAGLLPIVSAVWLAIAALLVLQQVVRAARFRQTLTLLATTTDQQILVALDKCRQELDLCRQQTAVACPRAVETSLVSSPALAGLFRPTLLLPCGIAARLSPQQLRYVLLHELAHLRRRDVLTGWLVAIVTAVHWFNPLVWLAAARFRADRELACDAIALAQIRPSQRNDYGLTILHLLASLTTKTPAPAVGLIGIRRAVRRRIRAITLYDGRAEPFAKWLAPLLCLAITLVTLTGPRRVLLAAPVATTSSSSTTTRTRLRSNDPGTETRVYAVRDLIIEIPDFTDAPDLGVKPYAAENASPRAKTSTSSISLFGGGEATAQQRTRAELVHDTEQLIRDTVDPASWKIRGGAIGSITEQSGNLNITQTPANHEKIESVLEQLRKTRGVQITVECRLLTGDEIFKAIEQVSKGNHWQITKDYQSWPVYLGNNDVQSILRSAESARNTTLITAPRLTLFNGQRAFVLVSRAVPFVQNFTKRLATTTQPAGFDPLIGVVQNGILLDVQATASLDRKAVTVTARPQFAKEAGFTTQRLPESPPGQDLILQIPHQDILKLQFTTSIPDGQAAIYRARLKHEPPSATQPVGEEVMLMIKPTIIIQRASPTSKPVPPRAAPGQTHVAAPIKSLRLR